MKCKLISECIDISEYKPCKKLFKKHDWIFLFKQVLGIHIVIWHTTFVLFITFQGMG